MPTTIYSDQSQPVKWVVREKTDVSLTLTVTLSAAAYDLTSYTFVAEFFKVGNPTAFLTLTQGAGITNGGAAGTIILVLTDTQLTISPDQYFWRLKTTAPSDNVWFNGVFDVKGYISDVPGSSSATIPLTLGGDSLSVALTVASSGVSLGETSTTAYRGDRGKTAYDHSQLTTGNPHNVTAAQAGADPSGSAAAAQAFAIQRANHTGTQLADTISNFNTAVQTLIDASVAGLLDLKGATDCSANPNYPSASKGDAYYVSVAGKIGGASGKSVDVGDLYVASVDNAGGTEASVGTSWFVLEHNLVGALLAANNLSDVTNPQTARNNILPSKTGNTLKVLRVNAGETDYELVTPSGSDAVVNSQASASSVTPDIDTYDAYAFTALAADLTINNPTGTPANLQSLVFRIYDNGTARALSWDTAFNSNGFVLPVSSTVGQVTYVPFVYNSSTSQWDFVSNTYEVSRTLLYKNNASASAITGVTTENVVDSFLIPAGTIQANDRITFEVIAIKTGTNSNTTIRVYVNDTANLSGSPDLIGFIQPPNTQLWIAMQRRLVFKNSLSSQLSFNVTATNQGTDMTAATATGATHSSNFANNKYIVISVQNAHISDSTVLNCSLFEIVR